MSRKASLIIALMAIIMPWLWIFGITQMISESAMLLGTLAALVVIVLAILIFPSHET